MYIQPELILDQYELVIKEIGKGRGGFICDAEQGSYVLELYTGTNQRAESLGKLLCYLKEEGIQAEQIVQTKDQKWLSSDETGNTYLLKEYVRGAECSTRTQADLMDAMLSLAKLHRVLSQYDTSGMQATGVTQLLEKHARELGKIQNYIQKKNKKNAFEQMFRGQYPNFREESDRAIEITKQLEQRLEVQVIHGEVTQHNLVRTERGWQLINYEKNCVSSRCSDLANFLRKIMEKNGWNPALGADMLEAYERVWPINPEEKQLLQALLLFPEKFWKISNHYYNSHKAWVSGRDIDKLQQVIEQQEQKHLFMKSLFPFA